jgi:DNA-binding LacI/PurR family transcriptional regulator
MDADGSHQPEELHLLLDALEDHGRVPPERSVVVMGSISPAYPWLTSVDLPAEEVGARAVDLIMDKIDGVEQAGVTLLEPRLNVRESTSPRA